ncbi:VanZ family protein [Paenibacillus antarcticus]|uniref:VanZ family protein n=1 Tax=Paenibacillus antarcticus TaxID=253703 RepID=UPI0020105F82|nr:VanZ family protein [Paenibacillus antarcticus]
MTIRKERRQYILGVLIIVYSACLLYWMFIGFGRTRHANGPLVYNVIPFETIGIFIRSIHQASNVAWIINLFGNIGVFIPFGLILPILFKRLRSYWRLMVYFFLIVTVLELSQMLLRAGSCDIDDVILNVTGVCIGYGILRLLFKRYISYE